MWSAFWYCTPIQYFAMFASALHPALNAAPNSSAVQHVLDALPVGVERLMWRGSDLGTSRELCLSSGWHTLDRELPGEGWPTRCATEILTPQPGTCEWRLLGPVLRAVTAKGGQVVVVGPPRLPHLPGLHHEGLSEHQFVWIQAETPAERLWVTEQLVKANAAGAVLAWLPQARQEQIRRLQVCAQGCEGPVFLFRHQSARHEASAAPLRLHATVGMDWQLHVEIFKRRGPACEGVITLESVPSSLSAVLTPKLLKPSALLTPEAPHALGRPAAIPRQRTPA